MTSFINTNLGSMNAQRHLSTNQAGLATSLERLSSGLRINNAKDDAAGLSISERFTSQIKGVNQAGRNANDGISMTQVAEGALATTTDNLQRIRELTVQAANATNTAGDRKTIQDEVNQLVSEMDRTAQTTQFNGINLMDGSASNMAFQVGANSNQTINITNGNFRTSAYGDFKMGAVAAGVAGVKDLTVGDLAKGTAATTIASGTTATTGRAAAAGVFTINGSSGSVKIDPTLASAIPTSGVSAKSTAAQINAHTAETNVTASAVTEVQVTFDTAGAYTFDLKSNNNSLDNVAQSAKTISMTIGSTSTGNDYLGAVNAFNAVSSTTGVTARLNDDSTGIIIRNDAGENITLSGSNDTTGGAAIANAGVATIGDYHGGTETATIIATGGTGLVTVSTGQLTLDSNQSFGVTAADTTFFKTAGQNNSSLQSVNMIDVTSVNAATRALAQVDSALATINAQRGLYGAMQSRFGNAVSNLQSTSESMSASRSRIQDTDFASETAQLTRGQILQQAGTAMLAQANSLPNGVLALLRG